MRKILKLLIAFIAMVSMSGCSQDEINVLDLQQTNSGSVVYYTVLPDTASVITASRAMEIAAMIKPTNPSARSVDRVAESVESIADENGNPLMYVVNYAGNQGFVILSATKAYTPILAQSDEGRFSLSNLDPGHPVNLWLEEQKFIAQHIDYLPDSIRTSAATAWMAFNNERNSLSPILETRADYPDKPQVYYDSLRQWTLDPDIEVYTYEDYIKTDEYKALDASVKNSMEVGIHTFGNPNYGLVESSSFVLRKVKFNHFRNQLTTTEWDQQNGYESSIPYTGKRLGCTTVAVGQFMKYHKHPSYINWGGMEDKYSTKAAADFLYQLGVKMGIDYSSNSFDRGEEDAVYALLSYGYKTKPASHDEYNVQNEVKKGNPVIMLGDKKSFIGISSWNGHAWLCDGVTYGDNTLELRVMTIDYRPTIYSTPDLMVEAYSYEKLMSYYPKKFHFNWGWGGFRNGFYDDSNIAIEDASGKVHDYKHGRRNIFATPK